MDECNNYNNSIIIVSFLVEVCACSGFLQSLTLTSDGDGDGRVN